MGIERERKYLLTEEQFEKMKSKSIHKIGIIQWYLEEKIETRIRVEFFKQKTGTKKIWTKTTKEKIDGGEKRVEIETTLSPDEISKINFERLPMVAKIRYIIKEDPEISVDEYLYPMKISYNVPDLRFTLEIEEGDENVDDLDLYLRENYFKNEEVKDITEDSAYKNKNIAKKNNVIIKELLDYVQNKLNGPYVLIMTHGISVLKKGNLFKDVFVDKNFESIKDESLYSTMSAEIGSYYALKQRGYDINKIWMIGLPKFMDSPNYEFSYNYCEELKPTDFSVSEAFHVLKILFKELFGITDILYEKASLKLGEVTNEAMELEMKESVSGSFLELWKILDSIFEKEKDKEVIIDAAGSVRYISMIASMYAMFNKKLFCSKHESHKEPSEFPPFGVDWDYNFLDEFNSMFNTITEKTGKDIVLSLGNYSTLPDTLSKMFRTKSIDNMNAIVPFYPLDKILEKFHDKKSMPLGYGENFLNLMHEDLAEYIKTMITSKWSIMWIGDQIPETVEHSQRHSKRLMEFTINLINVIGENEFLKNIEYKDEKYNDKYTYKDIYYFILAVAYNIHDLGHTLMEYNFDDGKKFKIESFPSLVRDLHNELTVQMISENKLNINGDIKEIFGDKYLEILELIKLVCKYHRGYMPIDEKIETDKKFPEIFKIDLTPLTEVIDKKLESGEISDKKLKNITIAASRWIKFIDATDVQSDRIVTQNYHIFRIERTIYETMHYLNKLRNIITDDTEDKCKINQRFLEIADEFEELLKDPYKNGYIIDKKAKKIEEEDIYPFIHKKIQNNLPYSIDEFKYELLDMMLFKSRQFTHFNKHKAVSAILPVWIKEKAKDNETDLGTLYLRIIPNKSYDNVHESEKNIISDNNCSEVLMEIKKDIKKEFFDAGLNNSHIKNIDFM